MIAALVVAGGGIAFSQFGSSFMDTERADLLTVKVEYERLPVTVVERGTLESTDNRDVICQVKAGSRGTFSSTIKRVIEDGSFVKRGQVLMELDDSALKESELAQSIVVAKANSAWVKAKEDYAIQLKMNESDIATKEAALKVAQLDLDKFLGWQTDEVRNPIAAAAGGIFSLRERGEYRMLLDDVSGRLKLAESDLEAYRDRSSWADRATKLGYITPSQAKVERSKLESALDGFEKLQAEKFALQNFTRTRDLTDLTSKVEVAKANYEQAILQARAMLIQKEDEVTTTESVLQQETDKLIDIRQQITECKLTAPQDGMAIYYKETSSRWSSSNQGMIAVGEQVKEGQKLLQIPDLLRLQVNTKVHESMIRRIRADERQPTGVVEIARLGLMGSLYPLNRLVTQTEPTVDTIEEAWQDNAYFVKSRGQKAMVRIDSFSDRLYVGRVKTVASVAEQADYFSSDVKMYRTLVQITGLVQAGSVQDEVVDFEYDMNKAAVYLAKLKPGMSAQVTIEVEAADSAVLTVPIQAVIGGAESGDNRKVYVMENGSPVLREIKLGVSNKQKVEVIEGVKEGELVVVNPKVIVGDGVKTREEQPDANNPAQGGPPGKGAGKGKGGPPKGKA